MGREFSLDQGWWYGTRGAMKVTKRDLLDALAIVSAQQTKPVKLEVLISLALHLLRAVNQEVG